VGAIVPKVKLGVDWSGDVDVGVLVTMRVDWVKNENAGLRVGVAFDPLPDVVPWRVSLPGLLGPAVGKLIVGADEEVTLTPFGSAVRDCDTDGVELAPAD